MHYFRLNVPLSYIQFISVYNLLIPIFYFVRCIDNGELAVATTTVPTAHSRTLDRRALLRPSYVSSSPIDGL